jgi:hypothetical protein
VQQNGEGCRPPADQHPRRERRQHPKEWAKRGPGEERRQGEDGEIHPEGVRPAVTEQESLQGQPDRHRQPRPPPQNHPDQAVQQQVDRRPSKRQVDRRRHEKGSGEYANAGHVPLAHLPQRKKHHNREVDEPA